MASEQKLWESVRSRAEPSLEATRIPLEYTLHSAHHPCLGTHAAQINHPMTQAMIV